MLQVSVNGEVTLNFAKRTLQLLSNLGKCTHTESFTEIFGILSFSKWYTSVLTHYKG